MPDNARSDRCSQGSRRPIELEGRRGPARRDVGNARMPTPAGWPYRMSRHTATDAPALTPEDRRPHRPPRGARRPPPPAPDRHREEPMLSLVGVGPVAMRPRYRWTGVWFQFARKEDRLRQVNDAST